MASGTGGPLPRAPMGCVWQYSLLQVSRGSPLELETGCLVLCLGLGLVFRHFSPNASDYIHTQDGLRSGVSASQTSRLVIGNL
jgi:hypothetical protein